MAAVMASPPIIRRLACRASSSTPTSTSTFPPAGAGRRHCLFLLTATAALKAMPSSAAVNIPLFGLRKKIEKAEEVADEVIKEGIQAAEKGLDAAENQIAAAGTAFLTVDASLQAGALAGAEVLGVVIATSIVNGILRPDK